MGEWGEGVFLGHFLLIIKLTWGVFFQNFQFDTLLQLDTKEYMWEYISDNQAVLFLIF